MAGEPNGRWWRTPSFSVEDLVKYAGMMVPLIGFFLMLWLDVRDIKRAIPSLATKAYVGALIQQSNGVHEHLNRRLRDLEKTPYKPLEPIRPPKQGEDYNE